MNAMSSINKKPAALDTLEAEEQLIGSVFINNDAADAVASFLRPEHFSEPFLAHIWDLIVQMKNEGQTVTPVTLKPFINNVMIGEMTA